MGLYDFTFYDLIRCHALTFKDQPAWLEVDEGLTLSYALFKEQIDLLACGIDPQKSILFIQSLVPQHTELTWIFSCITSYGELTRMTQFKDKSEQGEQNARGKFISAGLFTYPVLQAADILIYKGDYVPVGRDQVQHLELSRNIAVRFNKQFGEFFPEPLPLLTDIPKLVSLADPTKKMSKSLDEKHYIGLFEEEDSVRKKVRSAVTDTGDKQGRTMSPGVENLFNLVKACGWHKEYDELIKDYKSGTLKYKDLKDTTADALVELTSGFRKRRTGIAKDRSHVEKLALSLSEKAREIAAVTVRQVRALTGLPEL